MIPGTPSTENMILATTCDQISIRNFKKAMCLDDLSGLILSGVPSPEDLSGAWRSLQEDYSMRIKTDDSNYIVQTASEISQLQAHIMYVENAVLHLRVRERQDFVDELVKMGYQLEFKGHTEDWDHQLDRVLGQLKTVVFDLEILVDEYKRLQSTGSGEKMSVEDFDENVSMLAKYQGYHLNQDTTMMDEYIAVFNNCMRESRRAQKQLSE